MKPWLVRLVRLLVALFYRRVEVAGLENLPSSGPVLLVANHANGLVDPMLVLSALPRAVVFVAKSTLWKIAGLRRVLDLLGVVPVVRKREAVEERVSEGADRNEASFERLSAALRAGGAVLIFPEGRSHSEPALSPIRTGAARIAERAGIDVPLVPLGIWFTKKEEFRSDVLLRLGPRITLPGGGSIEEGTRAIASALQEVTLNAAAWEEHEVVAAVEALYGASLPAEGEGRLDRSFRNRRLLMDAREALEEVEPGAVASLARRARALVRTLDRAGLPASVLEGLPSPVDVASATARTAAYLLLGAPFAAAGVLAFWVPYRLTGIAAKRIPGARERDQTALYKILAGVVLFPTTLAVWVAAAFGMGGLFTALIVAIGLPLAGLFALRWMERFQWGERHGRALLMPLVSPSSRKRLCLEREALVAECDRLAARYAALGHNPRP